MTPDLLRRATGALPLAVPAGDLHDVLASLERLADERPGDAALASAIAAVHGATTAGDGLPHGIAGVRRETLVRWDATTSTWDGVDTATGKPVRVRTLRAWAVRDPVLRRALARDGRALRDVADVRVVDGDWPALVAPLPGSPLGHRDEESPDALPRVLGEILEALARWEDAGLGVPDLDRREILDGPDGVRVLCLTPGHGGANVAIEGLASTLLAWWGGGPPSPVDALLEGFLEMPPRTVADAIDGWRRSVAEHLASEAHAIERAAVRMRHRARIERLHAAVTRMAAALPPPEGRGAVGVDLEGRTTILVAEGGRMRWGPIGAEVEVAGPDRDLDAREARRLLRAKAAAPPNSRLQASVGGDPAFVESACRWIAGALAFRTIRLLLEAKAP